MAAAQSPWRIRRAALLCCLALLLIGPAAARAAGNPPGQPAPVSAPSGTPTLVTSLDTPPSGFHLTGKQVLAVAKRNATYIEEMQKHPHLVPYVYTRGLGTWQVSLFTPPPKHQIEMLQLYVDDGTDQVTQVWTGFQVAWTMARGYPGAFGKKINSLYIWIPLCLAFFLPFFPWRRRPTLWHLDLLVLLGFSISLAFFNNANIGLSAPLVDPFTALALPDHAFRADFTQGRFTFSTEAGAGERLSPHGLRAGCITEAYLHGALDEQVMAHARQTDITTTRGYRRRAKTIAASPTKLLDL